MSRRTFVERSILPLIALGGTIAGGGLGADSRLAPRSAIAATAAPDDQVWTRPVALRHGDEPACFVPTLETPLPGHGSAVWSAGLALAWSVLRGRAAPGTIAVRGSEELAHALDEDARTASSEVPDADGYAAAGRVRDGIADEIARELPGRFPGASLPSIPRGADGIACSHVEVDASFPNVYSERRGPLLWRDSLGRRLAVRAMGFARRGDGEGRPCVLYRTDRRGSGGEFALELSSDASPVEVIVALVHRETSLGETVRALEDRIAGYRGPTELGPDDGLAVPCVRLAASHRFFELEGPSVPGGAGPLAVSLAVSSVAFRMDEAGARESRHAAEATASRAWDYVVDRPFLVLAKKRGADRPFLVVWVDAGDLLRGATNGS